MAHTMVPGPTFPAYDFPDGGGYTAEVDQQPSLFSREHADLGSEPIGPLHATFFHGRVLRAGWGLVLFPALTVALGFVLLLFTQRLHLFKVSTDTSLYLSYAPINLAVLCAVLVATFLLGSLEHRRVVEYGFLGRRMLRLFLGGALSGAVLMTAFAFGLHQSGYLVFRGQTLFGTRNQLHAGFAWAAFFLLAALVEEALAQAYLQYTLTRGLASVLRNYAGAERGVNAAFWIGSLLLAPVFTLLHAGHRGESMIGFAAAGAYSLLLAFSLWRTGSLWWAIGFHFSWDWVQGFLLGATDSGMLPADHFFFTQSNGPLNLSGGSTGPEGGLPVLIAYALGAVLLLLTRRRKVYPDLWTEAEANLREHVVTLPDPGGRPTRR